MVSRRFGPVALALAAAACGAQPAAQRTAASVSAQVVGDCTELACPWLSRPGACDLAASAIGAPPGPYGEVQILDPGAGTTTVTSGGSSFSLTVDEGMRSLAWSATTAVDFVIVNDPVGGNVYLYAPPVTGDRGLGTDLDGFVTGATFCYGAAPWALSVSKSATATSRRTWTWSIEKSSPTSAVSLPVGGTVDASYVVTVTAVPADSGWVVTGEIVVQNPTPVDATGVQILDSYAGVAAVVDCGAFGGTLPAGEALTCSYAVPLAGAFDGTNVATVTTSGPVLGGTASAEVAFGAPEPVDECVLVTDDRAGTLGTVCAAASPATFSYTLPIGPYATCDASGLGTTFVNTASFAAPSGAAGSSTWTVAVQVPCSASGCTLTQGYWKTHSRKGPAPYDARWQDLGSLEESTPFFLSARTWYEELWTPVGGSPYDALAHQYMAAKLNVLAGASASALGDALATSEAFFGASTPATTLTPAQRAALTGLAALLDDFNSGRIGPGHCGDRGDDGSSW